MKKIKTPELVDNWKKLYKSWTIILSVIFGLANLVLGGLYFLTPFFDAKTFAAINFVFYMIVGAARMFKQDSLIYTPPPSPYARQVYSQTQEEEIKFSQFDSPDI